MSVDDHGLEAIRKSAHEVTPGNRAEYYLLTKIAEAVFSPSGLSKDYLITVMDVTDVASTVPTAPLVDRNSLIIVNWSMTEKVYIGKSNVTADLVNGTTSGWQIAPLSYFASDVKDSILFYGICEPGKTAKVQVFEVA